LALFFSSEANALLSILRGAVHRLRRVVESLKLVAKTWWMRESAFEITKGSRNCQSKEASV
jgi:hypothetical protein